ncbi:mucin-5AC-like [Patiria miniata]|uniref:HYR domain-containing protein n=1 Tax=Patiria miniata TaxID=46514 RepID=A0A913Z5J8_PATMI|nr:mucin-5AC-like [Patiria miniata]
MPPSPYPDIPDMEITVDGVEKLLSSLKVNKAVGPDEIPNAALKTASVRWAPVLQFIFSQSLDQNTENPNITCPNSVMGMSTDAGVSTASVTWSPAPSATDNVDTLTASDISCTDGDSNQVMSGGTFDLGTTTVTCTVSDAAGNSDTCMFTIEIIDTKNTTTPADTTMSGDTTPPDTIPPDTTPPETTPVDSIPPSTDPQDTTPQNTTPPDTTHPDTIPPDTTPPDTSPPDTSPPDTTPPDTNGEPPVVTVPTVEDQCIDAAQAPVSVTWDEVTATNISAENISCTDTDGNVVSLTGASFGVECHTVTCVITLPCGCKIEETFYFYIIAIPTFTVPTVDDQYIAPGMASIPLSWDKVNATYTDGQAINCTDDAGGTSVTVTGGDLPAGSHNVTCTVTNNGGCTTSAYFTFDVIELTEATVATTTESLSDTTVSITPPVTSTTPVSNTTSESTTIPTTSTGDGPPSTTPDTTSELTETTESITTDESLPDTTILSTTPVSSTTSGSTTIPTTTIVDGPPSTTPATTSDLTETTVSNTTDESLPDTTVLSTTLVTSPTPVSSTTSGSTTIPTTIIVDGPSTTTPATTSELTTAPGSTTVHVSTIAPVTSTTSGLTTTVVSTTVSTSSTPDGPPTTVPTTAPVTTICQCYGESPVVTVPTVEDQCIDAAQAPVSVTWDEVTATNISVENISCTDAEGNVVSLTGGSFEVECHTVTCVITLPCGCKIEESFYFYIIAIPIFTVSTADDQHIAPGQASIPVTWDEVNATNSDGQAITCTDDAGGTNVTVSGGDFPVGSHNVTCTVTNNGGCTASTYFTFGVIVSSTNPVTSTTPVSSTTSGSTNILTTIIVDGPPSTTPATTSELTETTVSNTTDESLPDTTVLSTSLVTSPTPVSSTTSGSTTIPTTIIVDGPSTTTPATTSELTTAPGPTTAHVSTIAPVTSTTSGLTTTVVSTTVSTSSTPDGPPTTVPTTTPVTTICQCYGEPPVVTVPTVEDQCIDAAEAPVSVTWDEVTATNISAENISCTDAEGNVVSLTGGSFEVECHTVTCIITLPCGCKIEESFYFYIIAIPIFTVPTVDDHHLAPGQASIPVTWDEVNATNSDGQAITCTDDAGGTNVTVTGGDFPVGSHNVTCTVTNNGGCTASTYFTFGVIVSGTNPVTSKTPVSSTNSGSTTIPTTSTADGPPSTTPITTSELTEATVSSTTETLADTTVSNTPPLTSTTPVSSTTSGPTTIHTTTAVDGPLTATPATTSETPNTEAARLTSTQGTSTCATPIVNVPTVSSTCAAVSGSTASVTWPAVTASNAAGGSISCSDSGDGASVTTTGGTFGVGSHTVTCTVTNSGSCTGSNSFTFVVAASPSVTVPTVGQQCTDEGSTTKTVAWTTVTATDTVGASITCSDSGDGTGVSTSSGTFGVGSHIITCSVTNSNGCSGSRSFTFFVSASPSISVPVVPVHCTIPNQVTTTVSWGSVTGTNTNGQTIQCASAGLPVLLVGSNFPVGSHTVTCTVTNNGGCTATKSFAVVVVASPFLTVPNVGDKCTDFGVATATVSWPAVSGTNLGGQAISCSEGGIAVPLSGGIAFAVGAHTVTCQVSNNGCAVSESFSFTVQQSPILNLPTVADRCAISWWVYAQVSWPQVTAMHSDNNQIVCIAWGISMPLTGGWWYLQDYTHPHTCFVANNAGCTAQGTFDFHVFAKPRITVPSVTNKCTLPGQNGVVVSWPAVTGTYLDGQSISCTEQNGDAVPLSGGISFGLGYHTVTCGVTVEICSTSGSFSFSVYANTVV